MSGQPGAAGAWRVRVRIAPSPTGYVHVGTARTALYNWAFSRQHGGDFVLRIEDTDYERSREEWVAGILAGLEWIGTPWDEGPYRQSERAALYTETLDRLYAAGALYACDCRREDVLERTKDRPTPGYDGYCRERGLERGPGRALRFAVPRDGGVTVVHDAVRGEVVFANSTIEDFVVARSSGDPLFVLAVVVDDRDMAISHVIRAEEHLPTTPKAVLIWEVLNRLGPEVPLPVFAHLPVLVNDKRQKISKRRDRVALEDFEALGYLPEAMANYLALLGWSSPSGDEVFGLDDLVANFRLEDVNDSPAFFDEKKLLHFNGVYVRSLTFGAFTARVVAWAERTDDPLGTAPYATEAWQVLGPLAQERVGLLSEVPSYLEFLFGERFSMEEASYEKAIARDDLASTILSEARERFGAIEAFEAAGLKAALEEIAEGLGRKLGKTQAPVRVATLGRSVGLPLFESLEALGRIEVLARIDAARERLGKSA